MKSLKVYFENHLIGRLLQTDELTYSFAYEDSWQKSEKSFPLSLAMPLEQKNFGNKITMSFFENLLPEGEALRHIEKTQLVSGPFEFLKRFGRDCAGAVVVTDQEDYAYTSALDQLIEVDMEKIDTAIREHEPIAEVMAGASARYLSLPGAQDKFPAIYKDEKLFVPTHGAPTTHIVKAPIWRSGVKESVYNEYYCMQLAKRVGLKVPNCQILMREKPLYIVERYDRVRVGKTIHRIHQQDFCQAQGFLSENKYEEKEGPTLKNNYDLIMNNVTIKMRLESLHAFMDWISFNLLIGNNDSHSKNISLLLRQGKIELAPFYDLLSTALYPKLKLNFSFKIGGRDRFHQIGKNQIEALEDSWQIKKGTFTERLQNMNDKMMAEKDLLAEEILEQHKKVKVIGNISQLIADRSKGFRMQGAII